MVVYNTATSWNLDTLPIKDCVMMLENGRVKVRYIGYARKHDEWRKANDIVDLNESNNNSDEKGLVIAM